MAKYSFVGVFLYAVVFIEANWRSSFIKANTWKLSSCQT